MSAQSFQVRGILLLLVSNFFPSTPYSTSVLVMGCSKLDQNLVQICSLISKNGYGVKTIRMEIVQNVVDQNISREKANPVYCLQLAKQIANLLKNDPRFVEGIQYPWARTYHPTDIVDFWDGSKLKEVMQSKSIRPK